jgi:thiamine-phosphate pyrophosphorylase
LIYEEKFMKPFRLIAVSDIPETEHRIGQLTALLENGLSCLHLRTGTSTADELEKSIAKIPLNFHRQIVLHGHYELAIRLKLKGIHLTEKTKKESIAPALLNPASGLQISASFHSIADLAANTYLYDYVFLSPVFDSISKSNYKSGFPLSELKTFLREFKQKPDAPEVIALGGIDATTIPAVLEIGFDGAALFGAIDEDADSLAAFKTIQLLVNR